MLKKMEFKEGVGVFTVDDKQVGKINRFILDPITKEITHVVVQKGWLFPDDKVVPLQWISAATDEKVILTENVGDFKSLPVFDEEHYIEIPKEEIELPEQTTYVMFPAYYANPPSGYSGYGGYPAPVLEAHLWSPVETTRNIPEDAIPLKVDAKVISSDDKDAGVVESIFVDPDSNRATHFVIAHGLFNKTRKIIPVQWVKSISENKVQLAISAYLLERVRDYMPEDKSQR